MAGQLMLSLSILIILHELGHFIPARLFKTRVEKFYLFFDPWFSLFKIKKGETEYGLGWLPLGGYVKISGMIDESFDTAQMAQEPQPWEFRSKPAWQRLIIMLGGVTVNFILGFILFGMTLFIWGETYFPASQMKDGIAVDSLGRELGLMDGDKILTIGDKPFEEFNDRLIIRGIIIDNAKSLEVLRNGEKIILPVEDKWVDILSRYENKSNFLFSARIPFIIGGVSKNSPAEKGGLKKDDVILGFNDINTPYFNDFAKAIKPFPGKVISFKILRDKDTLMLPVRTNENAKIGAITYPYTRYFTSEVREYTLLQALPAGFVQGSQFLGDQFKAFGQMFKGKIKASESLGGFGSIASMYGDTWIWERFWKMTAILSLILGFMNLLPIPALDGGHVMFLLYEVLTGRKPSDKFMEVATMIGFILILSLVIFANGLDIFRNFFNK
jgi:regulator of sigma E protease